MIATLAFNELTLTIYFKESRYSKIMFASLDHYFAMIQVIVNLLNKLRVRNQTLVLSSFAFKDIFRFPFIPEGVSKKNFNDTSKICEKQCRIKSFFIINAFSN